jgi:hypothetical protein
LLKIGEGKSNQLSIYRDYGDWIPDQIGNDNGKVVSRTITIANNEFEEGINGVRQGIH